MGGSFWVVHDFINLYCHCRLHWNMESSANAQASGGPGAAQFVQSCCNPSFVYLQADHGSTMMNLKSVALSPLMSSKPLGHRKKDRHQLRESLCEMGTDLGTNASSPGQFLLFVRMM